MSVRILIGSRPQVNQHPAHSPPARILREEFIDMPATDSL
jgi:hypothetical protein